MYQVPRPAGSTKYWRLLPPEHVQTSYNHVPGTSPKHTTKDVNNSHRAARSIPATTIAYYLHLRTLAPARLCLQAAAGHQENSGQKITREAEPRETHQAISARPCRPCDHVKGPSTGTSSGASRAPCTCISRDHCRTSIYILACACTPTMASSRNVDHVTRRESAA